MYDPELLEDCRKETVSTRYGTVEVVLGTYKGREVAFLARHGKGHSVPPHRINYRANIMALKQLGVERIVSTSAVGSLDPDCPPGTFLIVSQFLDFTKMREHTFFGGEEGRIAHVDVTEPYCPQLGAFILEAAGELDLQVREGGTYVCCEGPRYETAAEISMYRMLGGTVVGMTNVPECTLAREAEICYRTICIVTNFAAGISDEKLTHREVVGLMKNRMEDLKRLLMRTLEKMDAPRTCGCGEALDGASG